MGTGSFLGVKLSGHGVAHPPQSSAEVEERVEVYLYSTSEHLWPVLGWNLKFIFLFCIFKFLCSEVISTLVYKTRNWNIYVLQSFKLFYVFSSVHHNSRLKKSNKMQQYADIYLLLNYSTCFVRPSRPSSGVHKTTVAASGTDHTVKYKSWTRSVISTYRL